MGVNNNSIEAYTKVYNTDSPKSNKEKILATMLKHNRPLTYDQIAEYSGVDKSSLGQYIGRDLIQERLVYKLIEKGKSKKGNQADLYITKQFLHEKGEAVPPLKDDPRNPFDCPQLKMF